MRECVPRKRVSCCAVYSLFAYCPWVPGDTRRTGDAFSRARVAPKGCIASTSTHGPSGHSILCHLSPSPFPFLLPFPCVPSPRARVFCSIYYSQCDICFLSHSLSPCLVCSLGKLIFRAFIEPARHGQWFCASCTNRPISGPST